MSRGLGSVQTKLLELLEADRYRQRPRDPYGVPSWWLTEAAFYPHTLGPPNRARRRATPAEKASVKRALAGLETRGLIRRDPSYRPGREAFWTLVTDE